MTVVEIFTKRKIADIKPTEDYIDFEYMRRIEGLQKGNKSDLKLLLKDFEEFLPQGLQKFQHASDDEFEELMSQIRGFFSAMARGMSPMEPTEFFMLLQPPLIIFPRQWARQLKVAEGKILTWGQAFLDLSLSGAITKLMESQETMYKQVLKIAELEKERFATDGSKDEEIEQIVKAGEKIEV